MVALRQKTNQLERHGGAPNSNKMPQSRAENRHRRRATPTQSVAERVSSERRAFPSSAISNIKNKNLLLMPSTHFRVNAESIAYDNANCLRHHCQNYRDRQRPTMPEQLRTCPPHPPDRTRQICEQGGGTEQHFQGCWRMQRPRVREICSACRHHHTTTINVCYDRWGFVPPMRKGPISIAH